MNRTIFLTVWLLSCLAAFAQSTVHIYSPWAADPLKVTYRHHLYGGATGYAASADTKMTDEGAGWFSFSWPAGRTFSWEAITLRNCETSTDQNCNGGVYWTGGGNNVEIKMTTLFANQSEVWLYPIAGSPYYRIDFDPPGTKYVWFKSPWGNHSLPNMVAGADTVPMRFVGGDADHCGWFLGGVRPSFQRSVYFQRPYTNWTLPASGTLDLSTLFASADTAYVDGTVEPLVASANAGTPGTCFDSSRVVHVLHPWINDKNRGPDTVYVTASNNIVNNPVAMDSAGETKGWWRYSFDAKFVPNFKGSNLKFTSYYPKPNESQLDYKYSWPMDSLFQMGEYEVWIIPVGDSGTRVLRHPPPNPKHILFMNPWNATTPALVSGSDTMPMARMDGKCGWYRGTLYYEPDTWNLLFKKRLGKETYGAAGLGDVGVIALDSLIGEGDSAWVWPSPYPAGAPAFANHFPEILGDCGERKLAVMVLDWLGEGEDASGKNTNTESNSGKNTIDMDFGGAYAGNTATSATIDGKTFNGCQGLVKGMVEPVLGTNGVPVRSATFPDTACTTAKDLNNWFLPQKIFGEHTNATCRDVALALDNEGFWLADYYEDQQTKVAGFFPIDDFTHLDTAKQIPNPKWEGLNVDWRGSKRNYSFSMVVQAEFEYVKGQYFEFRGDDDVWVFINNKLVVDIGGVHGPLEGSVDLDTIGVKDGTPLVEGTTYPFHIFFAERNCCGSNFMMRTSMDLQTQRTYYPIEVNASSGQIRYEIWQILKEQSLACNFNGAADEKVDTVKASSSFVLYGTQFGTKGVSLVSGTNYGGILIDADMAGFTIDTASIMRSRALAPGSYRLVFTSSVDASLTGEIRFVVPSYPLPNIAFTDSLWNTIDPDTVVLGEWAFVPYPVHIQAQYMGVACSDCIDVISLRTTDSLVFLDSLRNVISSVKLDSGKARFWVMGKKALTDASFRAFGPSVANELVWKNIDLAEPPVPLLDLATMSDRNGDGHPDSLYMRYSRALKGKDAIDSLFWKWLPTVTNKLDATTAASKIVSDSLVILVGDSLVGSIATGSSDGNIFKGTVNSWFTYVPTTGVDSGKTLPFEIMGTIDDHVGPVIVKAEVSPGKSLDTLYVTLSESLGDSVAKIHEQVQLVAWRSGVQSAAQVTLVTSTSRNNRSVYQIIYANSAPVVLGVGDSIRLTPGGVVDMSGNVPHQNNPWVRIVGKQRTLVETPGLVKTDPTKIPPEKSPSVTVTLEPSDKSIKEIIDDKHLPGHLIRYDLGNLLLNDSTLTPADVELYYETWYYSTLGQFINKSKGHISCSDSIFGGDCSINQGNLYLAWNTRSDDGRQVGTGAYVVVLDMKVLVRKRTYVDTEGRSIWGLLRSK